MARTFFKVFGPSTAVALKWRRTPFVVRGALLTLWIEASMQDDEGYWPNRDDVEATLELDGCPDPPKVVDRLIALGWLDCTPEGCVVHDWPEWQTALRHPSDAPEATRARKRKSRASRAVTSGHDVTVVTTTDDVGHDLSRPVTTSRARGERENLEPSPNGSGKRLDPSVSKWFRDHDMSAPNGYVSNDLKALVKGYGADRVIAAMTESDGRTAKERVKGAERLLAPKNGNGRFLSPSKEEVESAFE